MPKHFLSDETHEDLKTLAASHHNFDSFLREMQLIAERVYHNHRRVATDEHGQDEHVIGTVMPREITLDPTASGSVNVVKAKMRSGRRNNA
jgi:hypothetical protein